MNMITIDCKQLWKTHAKNCQIFSTTAPLSSMPNLFQMALFWLHKGINLKFFKYHHVRWFSRYLFEMHRTISWINYHWFIRNILLLNSCLSHWFWNIIWNSHDERWRLNSREDKENGLQIFSHNIQKLYL